jgi:hypothetical protein
MMGSLAWVVGIARAQTATTATAHILASFTTTSRGAAVACAGKYQISAVQPRARVQHKELFIG